MSYKILYITPHLSTGGCPQYLLKKMSILKDTHDVYCVEYNDYGEWFVVQKNQVKEMLGSKHFALKDNKHELLSIIDKIDPDIIHLEEMPEYYMDHDVAVKVYSNTRRYHIVETSHDSSFDVANKKFFPDQFVFVSEYQKRNMTALNIDSKVIEYPILYKERVSDRDGALKNLGLDPELFHVVNVGLWSSRKNQGEIVEYARQLSDVPVQFHFVGNTAGNFQDYWGPILANLPSNCKVWGERKDVDTFYSCMDMFLFTSRGNEHDKETSPIVIREAISYRIPSLIYNLPVYLNMYDRFSNITYLNNNAKKNVDMIRSFVQKKSKPINYAYVVSTYPSTDIATKTTIKCLRNLTNSHKILVTHHNSYKDYETIADTVVYDPVNPIIKHSFYSKYWYQDSSFRCDLNLKANDNNNYHGLAVWTNYQNGIRKAKDQGFKYSVCLNYDIVLNDQDLKVVNDIVDKLEHNSSKGFFMHEVLGEGDTLKTVFFVIDNDYFLNNFDIVVNEEQYNESIRKNGCPSNSLENYVYYSMKNKLKDLTIVDKSEEDLFPNSDLNSFSCVEYFSVVPNDTKDCFYIWKSSSNIIDNKNVVIRVYENKSLILRLGYCQLNDNRVYHPVKIVSGRSYGITLEEFNSNYERINNKLIQFVDVNEISDNGSFVRYPHGPLSIDSTINIHHIDSNDKDSSIPSLTALGVVYRDYLESTELEVVQQLYNFPSHINVVVTDGDLAVSPDAFIQKVRFAHDYAVKKNIPTVSLVHGETDCIGSDDFYYSTKRSGVNGYVINNQFVDLFKTIQSYGQLTSYMKTFSRQSVIK